MVAIGHLAGNHRYGILKPRLLRAYRADSLSDLSLSVWDEFGYFTLSVLLFRSWRGTFPRLSTRWCLQWATLAFVGTALVAALDEVHQSFVPSRTGIFRDVVLDSFAALVAQIVIFALLRRRSQGLC
jgi:VanZ family protein